MYSDIETKQFTEEHVEASDMELEEIEPELEAPLLSDEGPEEEPEERIDKAQGSHDPVLSYMREIGSVPLLSREREVELGKQMQLCRDQILEVLFSTPMALGYVLELGAAVVGSYISLSFSRCVPSTATVVLVSASVGVATIVEASTAAAAKAHPSMRVRIIGISICFRCIWDFGTRF